MRFKLLLFSIFLFVQANGQESLENLLGRYNSGNVPYISVEELRMNQLNDKVLVLDAREPEEYRVSHIRNAVFVGYNDFDISRVDDYPRDTKIVVYCSLGIRSEKIGKELKDAGFSEVFNLYGGIFYWKGKGYEVVDMKDQETEKVHAYSESWSKWLKNAQQVF